uniref:Alpha/beta hydrolase fold-3 domain-containing protein n=1 Tax=Bionectria ochroleuca TaxID=29856 RepID=A0A8H7N8M3_BIOOC
MAPVWSKQPFKAIYVAILMVKVPLMLLLGTRFAFKPFRPLGRLSFKITLINSLVREWLLFAAQTRSSGMATVKSDHEKIKERCSQAQPAGIEHYTGVLTAQPTANPASVGGLWYPGPPSPTSDVKREKIVVHFPGGAFVMAFGADVNGQKFSKPVLEKLKADRFFFAQYRVAEDESTRFPAPMQDLVTFYHHVLNMGYDASNILLSGDSAGANILTGFVRYLEETSVLPSPKGVMLWSPWTNPSVKVKEEYDQATNASADLLPTKLLQWGVEAYFPVSLSKEVIPYLCPLHHAFKTKASLFVHTGDAEGLYESTRDFAQEMSEVEGNRVKLHVTEGASHNPVYARDGTGMVAEIYRAFEDAHQFFYEDGQ